MPITFKKIVSWLVAVWLSEPSHMGAALHWLLLNGAQPWMISCGTPVFSPLFPAKMAAAWKPHCLVRLPRLHPQHSGGVSAAGEGPCLTSASSHLPAEIRWWPFWKSGEDKRGHIWISNWWWTWVELELNSAKWGILNQELCEICTSALAFTWVANTPLNNSLSRC